MIPRHQREWKSTPMDRDTWNFVNSFAPWLSALGTFSAVVVSLYLANRDRRIRLKLTAGIRVIAFSGQTLASGMKVISVEVTNVGFRTVTVSSIFWRVGILKRVDFVQIPSTIPYSSSLPATLTDGQTASYPLEVSEFERLNFDSFRKAYSSRFRQLAVKCIKIGVLTSTGKVFLSRVEPSLQKWFLEWMNDTAA